MESTNAVPLPKSPAVMTAALPSAARLALVLAGAYAAFGTVYIFFSTKIAAAMSISVEQMRAFETYKGVAFIAVTSAALFLFSYLQFRRLTQQEERISRQMQALDNADRAIFAGVFAGTIAHDINNALSASMLAAETLRDDLAADPERAELAGDVLEALRSIQEWNRRLFEVGGRSKLSKKTPLDLAEIIKNCVDLAKRHQSLRGRTITVHGAERPFPYTGSDQYLRRAVLNLLLNAAEATSRGGKIEVRLARDEANAIHLSVHDDGPGVPEEMRKKVLEPFFTTKPEGTGMGLASVAACAQIHGGRVLIGQSPLGGASFDVSLAP